MGPCVGVAGTPHSNLPGVNDRHLKVAASLPDRGAGPVFGAGVGKDVLETVVPFVAGVLEHRLLGFRHRKHHGPGAGQVAGSSAVIS